MAATILAWTTTNQHTIQQVRTIRRVASIIFLVLAFLPTIMVVSLLLLPKTHNEGTATIDHAPAGLALEQAPNQDNKLPGTEEKSDPTVVKEAKGTRKSFYDVERDAINTLRPCLPGEPWTGFGPKPTLRSELFWNAFTIIVPSLLFTWEQGVRTGQAFFVPTSGLSSLPWVRYCEV